MFVFSTAQQAHDYYMKLVPTVYQPLSGGEQSGYQYTYAYKVTVLDFINWGVCSIRVFWGTRRGDNVDCTFDYV